MAHYAADCWDAEVRTSAHGWVEVVGHADRACYDLECHSNATGIPLVAWAEFAQPVVEKKVIAVLNRAAIGKALREQTVAAVEQLEQLARSSPERALAARGILALQVNGAEVQVSCGAGEMVQFQEVESKECGLNFKPRVIEPSFGIDRLLYCTLEKSFYTRETDSQRTVLCLPAALAPFKCCVTGLSATQLAAPVARLHTSLCRSGVSSRVDDSSVAIGRRYARMDEIGVPFIITVDFEHELDGQVTVRERDSCQQLRVPVHEVVELVVSLTRGLSTHVTWEEAKTRYPLFDTKDKDDAA